MSYELNRGVLPRHIGIIMDGNGRWAKNRGLPRTAGHKQGVKVFEDISGYCRDIGIKYLTVYAFSTENWSRPRHEVDTIMQLFRDYLVDLCSDEKKCLNEGIRIKFIGDISVLKPELKDLVKKAEEMTSGNKRMTLNIAVNYGGRSEIVSAVRRLAQAISDNGLTFNEFSEQNISQYLDTAGQPDPDIIIRPGGEKRISNFLLWQSAYAEFIFMDAFWPDFTVKHIDEVILEYNKRERRYGKIGVRK